MELNVSLLSCNQIDEYSGNEQWCRILSINNGKNICVGVCHLDFGFAFFNCNNEIYNSNKFRRGDLLLINFNSQEKDNKSILNITKINDIIHCEGTLQNSKYKGINEVHSITQTIFDPYAFEILRMSSCVMQKIRTYLYEKEFNEISTPTLFNKASPSNAPVFSLKTENDCILYLKSIHEHLLKPYLIVGFKSVFEIGHVYRNIKNSHEYDCEFTNIDIWEKEITINKLIDLTIDIVQITRKEAGLTPLKAELFTFESICSELEIATEDPKLIKKYVAEKYNKGILFITEYPRNKNFHTKPTQDKKHNLEFHAFLNGLSFAHGYLVNVNGIETNPSLPTEKCQIFEEYSKFGIREFGGVGIGFEKLLQGAFGITDYNKLNLYRRKY